MNSSHSVQKQYGLIKTVNKTQPSTSKPSIFGDDSSSDEASAPAENWGKTALKAISHGSVQAAQTRQVIRQAMQEDPTLFQYDEVYEDMQQHKLKKAEAKQTEGQKPRYMAKLLDAAELRRHQQERRVERQVQRERQEEGDEFADKEQFVTSAYRQRLMEREKEEEQERHTKRIEELTDVTKQKDLGSFYRHMYQQVASADQSPSGEVKTEPTDRLATPSPEGGPLQPHQQDSPRPVAPPTATGRLEQTRPAGRQYRRRRSSSSDVSPERARSAADAKPADGRDPPPTAVQSRSPDRPTGRDRPHRQDRSHRRHRSRSGDQLHKRERSRSGDRSHRRECPRSRDRSHKRERPRSRDRSHKRERSRSGDRAGKRSRSRSGDEQKAQPACGDGHTLGGGGRSTGRDTQRARASSPVRAVGTGAQPGGADAEREARRRALYEKRTVGTVFEAARERYLARRAAVLEPTPLVASLA